MAIEWDLLSPVSSHWEKSYEKVMYYMICRYTKTYHASKLAYKKISVMEGTACIHALPIGQPARNKGFFAYLGNILSLKYTG